MLTVFATIIAASLLICIVVFGRRREGYRHARHTISELGEQGAADHGRVRWGVFLPVGLGCMAVAALASTATGPAGLTLGARVLAGSLGAGYLIAALFPCDPGSPLQGGWRQGVHNLGGGVEYVGGALGLLILSPELGQVASAGAVIVVLGTIGVSWPGLPWRGAVQRLVESVLFGSLIFSIWQLESQPAPAA
jgi:hypothetical protein